MNIRKYIDEFAKENHYLPYDVKTVHDFFKEGKNYSLVEQDYYWESEYLPANIKLSVSQYTRSKKTAIEIYKAFLSYLKKNGIVVDVVFPPIDISNSFERLMFISKYLQHPDHKISDLYAEEYDPDKGNNKYSLWSSERTIRDDVKKLIGKDDDPIQICGKIFKIDESEHKNDVITFKSTAHPLFLTPNLTQVLVTLKGLKLMSENKLYHEYARLMAASIWEQLSDYAKDRIKFVLTELLPDDLLWYESLDTTCNTTFKTEYQCSEGKNIVLDCLKNKKPCYLQYSGENGWEFYNKCTIIKLDGDFVIVHSNNERHRLEFNKIITGAYTPEKLSEISEILQI